MEGLSQVGVHTLRHTYATTALLNGVPMHVVSRNLGHSSIIITADIYGHLTDDAARSAALVVSDALNLGRDEPVDRRHRDQCAPADPHPREVTSTAHPPDLSAATEY